MMLGMYTQKWMVLCVIVFLACITGLFQVYEWREQAQHERNQHQHIFETRKKRVDQQHKLHQLAAQNKKMISWLQKKHCLDTMTFEKMQDYLDSLKKHFPSLLWALKKDGHEGSLIKFDVSITLEGLNDQETWNVIKFLNEQGHGYWILQSIDQGRIANITPDVLDRISQKQDVNLIKAHLRYHWFMKVST